MVDNMSVVKKTTEMFCDNMHMLFPRRYDGDEADYKGEMLLFCNKCKQYYEKTTSTVIIQKGEKKDIVISEEMTAPPNAGTTNYECPECGPVEAFTWSKQMSYADEPPCIFTRCKECGHTEREGGF